MIRLNPGPARQAGRSAGTGAPHPPPGHRKAAPAAARGRRAQPQSAPESGTSSRHRTAPSTPHSLPWSRPRPPPSSACQDSRPAIRPLQPLGRMRQPVLRRHRHPAQRRLDRDLYPVHHIEVKGPVREPHVHCCLRIVQDQPQRPRINHLQVLDDDARLGKAARAFHQHRSLASRRARLNLREMLGRLRSRLAKLARRGVLAECNQRLLRKGRERMASECGRHVGASQGLSSFIAGRRSCCNPDGKSLVPDRAVTQTLQETR